MERWGIIVVGLLAAGVARGGELRTSSNVSTHWDDNAANAGDNASNAGDEAQGGDVRLDTGAGFVLVSDTGARSAWTLGYFPTYELFLDLTELDNWRHRGYGTFEYALSQTTRVEGRGEFSRSIRSNLEQVLPSGPDPSGPQVQEQDQRIDLGSASLNLSHALTSRWSASALGRYAFSNYGSQDLSDFESASAGGNLNYQMTARQVLGVGVSYARQVVKQADVRTVTGTISAGSDQVTNFASLYGSWRYKISPLWSVDLRAGPSRIESDLENTDIGPLSGFQVPLVRDSEGRPALLDARSCPALHEGDIFLEKGEAFVIGGECGTLPLPDEPVENPAVTFTFSNPDELESQGSSSTLFSDLSIARAGERTRFSAGYSRSAAENFGGRTSTVADVLSSTFSWRASSRTTIDLRGFYSVQRQATQASLPSLVLVPNEGAIPGLADGVAIAGLRAADGTGEIRVVESDSVFDVENWGFTLRCSRRFTKRFSAFVTALYAQQTNNGDFGDRGAIRDTDRLDIGIGLNYAFDPIRL